MTFTFTFKKKKNNLSQDYGKVSVSKKAENQAEKGQEPGSFKRLRITTVGIMTVFSRYCGRNESHPNIFIHCHDLYFRERTLVLCLPLG